MHLPVVKPLYILLKWLGFPVIWEVSVGSTVFFEQEGERRYLLLRYPSGHLDFVKGHIEKGETEEMTLRRETEEESGIRDLHIFPHRMSIRYFYIAKGSEREKRIRNGKGIWIFKIVYFYPAETKTEEVKISFEHTGFVWLHYKEAFSQVTFSNAKNILSGTEKYLNRKKTKSL